MPVKVQFIMGEPETMTDGRIRTWLKKANCAPPQDEDSQRVLALFLQKDGAARFRTCRGERVCTWDWRRG